MTRVAGIVLAGGRSSRMGRPKAALAWEGTTFVGHVAAVLTASVDGPVVVVRAPGQPLPDLPAAVEVAEDARAGRGPLEGIATGLGIVRGRAATVYVTATDVPLLRPGFVRTVVAALGEDFDAAVPAARDRVHPLAAAYRTSVLPVVERLLGESRLRALDLLEELRVRWLAEPELRAADPDLASLRNVNTPEEYEAVLAGRPS